MCKKCVEQLISGSKNSEENRIWPYSWKMTFLFEDHENVLWRGDWLKKEMAMARSGQELLRSRRASVMVLGKKYREERIYLNLREEVWEQVFKVGSLVLFFSHMGISWVFYAAEWYDLNFTNLLCEEYY